MAMLVVYDSLYGNTQQVAEAIAAAMGEVLGAELPVMHHGQAGAAELQGVDLLLVGSPTHGALPTEAMQRFLERLAAPARRGSLAATFDTRLTWPFLERWGGFAASKMAEALEAKGWSIAAPPGGFYVRGLRKGPLKKGEDKRAASWGRQVAILASRARRGPETPDLDAET